ncbi:MAG: hypothetical protein ACRENZ_06675, partial [Thermodesulfobacteriota bacterium]
MDFDEVFRSTLLIGPEITIIITGLILIISEPFLKSGKKKELFWVALSGLAVAFALNLNRFHNPYDAYSGALSLDIFSGYFN